MVILLAACAGLARAAQGGGGAVTEGNALYAQGHYDKAVGLYDQALTENPKLDQARFNKADAFFRMDDLAKAMDLYSEVSAQSKDMDLVKKAKYNLGNAYCQRGLKQRDSNLQKALEDLRTSITYWRAVLDLDPANENAKRNKEVAGLIIKDILDQIKKKQEQQKQQGQDPNQTQNAERRTQNTEQNKQGQDPNQNAERKAQSAEQKKDGQDPNQQPATSNPQPQKIQASDATAQEILDKEQQQKKGRERVLKAQRVPVDKDW